MNGHHSNLIKKFFLKDRARTSTTGQVMILTVMTIGITILGITTIAGLLMLYQIRQTTDLTNSTKAIYAADAGTEWGLFEVFQNGDTNPFPRGDAATSTFSNGASVVVICYDGAGIPVSCKDVSTQSMKSVGTAGGTSRAFGVSL